MNDACLEKISTKESEYVRKILPICRTVQWGFRCSLRRRRVGRRRCPTVSCTVAWVVFSRRLLRAHIFLVKWRMPFMGMRLFGFIKNLSKLVCELSLVKLNNF